MTGYERGDVLLALFTYSEETGAKRRPAVVVSNRGFNEHRNEVVAVAVTSNITRVLAGDHVISNWRDAGLELPSVATGVVRTIGRARIARKLGTLSTLDMDAIDKNLRAMLSL